MKGSETKSSCASAIHFNEGRRKARLNSCVNRCYLSCRLELSSQKDSLPVQSTLGTLQVSSQRTGACAPSFKGNEKNFYVYPSRIKVSTFFSFTPFTITAKGILESKMEPVLRKEGRLCGCTDYKNIRCRHATCFSAS